MKTRTSKIARLPFHLREQLNLRIQNGEPGSSLLAWLNQKPIVKKILLKYFNAQLINKQNLSDWRQGGYRDWVRHQSRQQTIQRLAEQGDQFNDPAGPRDLCESFSQIVLAELADELEHLHEITDRKEHWRSLREISRELARLQHGFNHSRSVELAWTKWNDQFAEIEEEPVQPSQPQSRQRPLNPLKTSGTNGPVTHDVNPSPSPPRSGGLELLGKQRKESAESGGPPRAERAGASESLGRGEVALSFTPDTTTNGDKDQNAESNLQSTPPIETVDRFIYHRRCGRGCVCPDCHPENGLYPYSQAVQDDRVHEDHSSPYWIRGHLRFWITHCDCDCYCPCEKTHPFPNQNLIPNAAQPQPL